MLGPWEHGAVSSINCRREETLAKALGEGGKELGIYVVAHVGSNCVQKSRELAMCPSVGANAIASVPPFYLFEPATTDANIDNVLGFLREISMATPNLPFLYYHIVPNIFQNSVTEFCRRPTKISHLIGIKWVKMNYADWFSSVQQFNKTHALLFAPEPKLASFGWGLGAV